MSDRSNVPLAELHLHLYGASVGKERGSVAKEAKRPKPKAETSFQRFRRLAQRIVSVPRDKAKGDKSEPEST